MKLIRQKCTCMLLMCMLCVFMTYQMDGKVMQKEPIDLIPPGGWGGGPGINAKSMTILPPVSASIEGTLLHVQCASPIVDVTVRVIQNGMIVYEKFVPATNTDYIWLDLSGYVAGEYTLDLTNSSGGHVYGYFQL